MTTETKSVPNTIKFAHAENGDLDVCNGDTVFSSLLAIGALTKAAKSKYTGDAIYKEYPTDIEGLERLQDMSSEALVHISSTIATLGKMLVYVDRENLGDSHIDNLGWLITGLGEVLGQLSYENDEINHTLTQLNKQNATSAPIKTERASKQDTIQ